MFKYFEKGITSTDSFFCFKKKSIPITYNGYILMYEAQ
jgi:hypothetical protein